MITNDQLKEIHQRTEEYCRVKYDDAPNHITIDENGIINAVFDIGRCEIEYDEVEIPLECLTQDLDEVRAERLEAQRIENAKREKQRLIDKAHREERELRERKRTYENLKKEFGDTE